MSSPFLIKPKLTSIYAPDWDIADSYGRVAIEMSAGMIKLGYTVNHFGPNSPDTRIKLITGGALLGYPTNFHKFGPIAMRGPKIAVTMFESTKLPGGWVDVLNDCQAVVVPCSWNEEVFKANGVKAPIFMHPLGVSREYCYKRRVVGDGPFTFLAIGDRGKRKGWHTAALAFNKAFGDREDVRLILKSRTGAMPFTFTNKNVEVISEDYTDEQMAELYQRCHVMVFPTAGEGFGLPPREFAATGGLVIATNFGGTADDLPFWGIPLGYKMVPAWKGHEKLEGCGEWAEPKLDDLAMLMECCMSEYTSLQRTDASRSSWVIQEYSWLRFSEFITNIWEKIT